MQTGKDPIVPGNRATTDPTTITDAQSFTLEMIDATLDFEDDDHAPDTPAVVLNTLIELLGKNRTTQSGIVIQIENEARDPDQPYIAEIVIENYDGHPRIYIGVGLNASDVQTFHLDLKTGEILYREEPRLTED